jgi:hypothetical protein
MYLSVVRGNLYEKSGKNVVFCVVENCYIQFSATSVW